MSALTGSRGLFLGQVRAFLCFSSELQLAPVQRRRTRGEVFHVTCPRSPPAGRRHLVVSSAGFLPKLLCTLSGGL